MIHKICNATIKSFSRRDDGYLLSMALEWSVLPSYYTLLPYSVSGEDDTLTSLMDLTSQSTFNLIGERVRCDFILEPYYDPMNIRHHLFTPIINSIGNITEYRWLTVKDIYPYCLLKLDHLDTEDGSEIEDRLDTGDGSLYFLLMQKVDDSTR